MKKVLKAVLVVTLVLGYGFASSSQVDLASDPNDPGTGGK